MNYADLFRATLPETVLEIAALLVLVVDLGFLRKARCRCARAVAALLGVAGCGAASVGGDCCGRRGSERIRAARSAAWLSGGYRRLWRRLRFWS